MSFKDFSSFSYDVQEEVLLNDFSIFSSGGHFV